MLMAPQGLDVLFAKDRLEIGRNFMNKLWNACRFVDMNAPENWEKYEDLDYEFELADKWILNKLNDAIKNYNRQLKRFYFNEAAKVLYDFVWSDFCDRYIDIAKTRTPIKIRNTLSLRFESLNDFISSDIPFSFEILPAYVNSFLGLRD